MNKRKNVIGLILMPMLLALTVVPAAATPTTLSGSVNYYTYAPKNGEVLQDVNCPATADLIFLDGQEIELVLTEDGVCGGRTNTLDGEITPSGRIKVWYPDPLFYLPDGTAVRLEDIVKDHAGCTFLAGPFPVYHGSFDGGSFVADTIFNCMIPEYWPANDIFPTPVDGPAQFRWAIDLTISP